MRFSAPFGNVNKTCNLCIRSSPPESSSHLWVRLRVEVRIPIGQATDGQPNMRDSQRGQPWTPIRAQTTHQFRPYRVPFAYRALPTPLTRFWLRPRRPESLRGWQASDEG